MHESQGYQGPEEKASGLLESCLIVIDTDMEFKEYVLHEDRAFLDQRISDVLSAVQDLNDSAENMGVRHLVSNAEKIVKQIRRIIHTHWPEREEPRLKALQKCGVAIMKAIEEKDDLQDVLKSCQDDIEEISGGSTANEIGDKQ